MRLSKRTEYGLRAMVQVARLRPDQFAQSRDVARQEGLPTKFLESILLTLRRGGMLRSKVGSGGGYRVARPPGEITVGEIVRLLERDDADPAESLDPNTQPPGQIALCLIRGRLDDAAAGILDSITLEGLAEEVGRRLGTQTEMYYI